MIGIGILAYNRPQCLNKLMASIRKYGSAECRIYISDESVVSSDGDYTPAEYWWFRNRGGVAVNTNRLLKMLETYEYKILLNDDVEILKEGWQFIYPEAIEKTYIHHFCYNQPELFGASKKEGELQSINGIGVQTMQKRPHGAVIAFDDLIYKQVGLFDESFGQYGYEHVDWTWRCSLTDLQDRGTHDRLDSDQYFRINKTDSADPGSREKLAVALALYKQKWNNEVW